MLSEADARAEIKGSKDYNSIEGTVLLYQTDFGVIIAVEINGLPDNRIECMNKVYGFHIHEGGVCTGNNMDPFANTKSHYNLYMCSHPYHAGDMPPLFGNNGYAFMMFLTNRINVKEVIGRTIVIHDMPDDFTTQPSGNAGNKIACGVIKNI